MSGAQPVTKAEFPTLFEAFETISHDGGGRAGHRSYVLAGSWDFARVDRELATLTAEQLQEFCIGDHDENADRRAELPYCEEVLNAFFEEGRCPVCEPSDV